MASPSQRKPFFGQALIEVRGVSGDLTWEAYGRRLYDLHSAFLDAQWLAWNEEARPNGLTFLSKYRDWSSGE